MECVYHPSFFFFKVEESRAVHAIQDNRREQKSIQWADKRKQIMINASIHDLES